jgi:hypothetical protein
MSTPEWELEFYEEDGREPVLEFLRGLDEVKEPSPKRQNAEIKRAKQRLTHWKAEQERLAKQARPLGAARKRQGKRRP